MSDNINKSSFVSHLTELRSRLIKSLIFIFVIFVIGYIFAENIYNFLVEPYAKAVKDDGVDRRLFSQHLHETFITYLKVSFFCCYFFRKSNVFSSNLEICSSRFISKRKKSFITLFNCNTNIIFTRRNA